MTSTPDLVPGPTSGPTSEHEPQALYVGPARLGAADPDGAAIDATVSLRGVFQPLDGHYHWYGRLDAGSSGGLRGGDEVRVSTPHGAAVGRLSDRDPWGRWRIGGTGTPPF